MSLLYFMYIPIFNLLHIIKYYYSSLFDSHRNVNKSVVSVTPTPLLSANIFELYARSFLNLNMFVLFLYFVCVRSEMAPRWSCPEFCTLSNLSTRTKTTTKKVSAVQSYRRLKNVNKRSNLISSKRDALLFNNSPKILTIHNDKGKNVR